MKLLTLNAVAAAKLQPKARVLFDKEEAEKNTSPQGYTKEQLDASYQAGLKAAEAKAKESKQAKELERLKKFEADQIAQQEQATITTALKDDKLKETGLKGQVRFAKEFVDRLKGKEGDALIAEVKKIKSEPGNEIYFSTETEVNAAASLAEAAKGNKKQVKKKQYYPGTTIPMR